MSQKATPMYTIDYCKCIYCGHPFDGEAACGYRTDRSSVQCPKCHREMIVYMSIEYLCLPMDEDDAGGERDGG